MNKYLEKIAGSLQMDQSVLKGKTKPMTLSNIATKRQPNPLATHTLGSIVGSIGRRKGLKGSI